MQNTHLRNGPSMGLINGYMYLPIPRQREREQEKAREIEKRGCFNFLAFLACLVWECFDICQIFGIWGFISLPSPAPGAAPSRSMARGLAWFCRCLWPGWSSFFWKQSALLQASHSEALVPGLCGKWGNIFKRESISLQGLLPSEASAWTVDKKGMLSSDFFSPRGVAGTWEFLCPEFIYQMAPVLRSPGVFIIVLPAQAVWLSLRLKHPLSAPWSWPWCRRLSLPSPMSPSLLPPTAPCASAGC